MIIIYTPILYEEETSYTKRQTLQTLESVGKKYKINISSNIKKYKR